MNIAERTRLRKYIRTLKEEAVWQLLVDFFASQHVGAHILHAPGEHGMDVVAYIKPDADIVGIGFNILVQVKINKLTVPQWRKDVLYQLLETPYFTIGHPVYDDTLSRRVLLVVTDSATPEARRSIKEFNAKHEVTIDLWELDDLVNRFEKADEFAAHLLQIIGTGVGEGEEITIEPTTVGSDS